MSGLKKLCPGGRAGCDADSKLANALTANRFVPGGSREREGVSSI